LYWIYCDTASKKYQLQQLWQWIQQLSEGPDCPPPPAPADATQPGSNMSSQQNAAAAAPAAAPAAVPHSFKHHLTPGLFGNICSSCKKALYSRSGNKLRTYSGGEVSEHKWTTYLRALPMPPVLAWCITIHKVQCLSLDKAVIDLGKKGICSWPSICATQQGAQP